jgi:hypothetical protein
MTFVDGLIEVRVSTTEPLLAQISQGLNQPQDGEQDSLVLPGSEALFTCPPGGRLTTRPDGIRSAPGGKIVRAWPNLVPASEAG